eukprot:CFRG5584T1
MSPASATTATFSASKRTATSSWGSLRAVKLPKKKVKQTSDPASNNFADKVYKALSQIPYGQTRTVSQLTALAGSSGQAAVAASGALNKLQLMDGRPWHRAVPADGIFKPRPPPKTKRGNAKNSKKATSKDNSVDCGNNNGIARVKEQLARLRAEGARPEHSESISEWARRIGVSWVGVYKKEKKIRVAYPMDKVPSTVIPEGVEPLKDRDESIRRGFRPMDMSTKQWAIDYDITLRADQGINIWLSQEALASAQRDTHRNDSHSQQMKERVNMLEWNKVLDQLASVGVCQIPGFLTPEECRNILAVAQTSGGELFDGRTEDGDAFSGALRGLYAYIDENKMYSMLPIAAALRENLYARLRLALNANSTKPVFPANLQQQFDKCRDAGQTRSSAIMLTYGQHGINHPHQDKHGTIWFPLQAMVCLSKRGNKAEGGEFTGGEFYLIHGGETGSKSTHDETEVKVDLGDVVIFASNHLPTELTAKADLKTDSRRQRSLFHGVREVTWGQRKSMGLCFQLLNQK